MRVALAIAALVAAGCKPGGPARPAPPPPLVLTAPPLRRTVTEYEYATGRITAVENSEVRSQVSGFIKKIHYQRGAEVKAGALLVELDPEPFVAAVRRNEADLKQAEARRERLQADFERVRELRRRDAASQEDFDKVAGDLAEAKAAAVSQQARLDSAKLDAGHARIAAPISGILGDRLPTEGNFAIGGQANSTLLATILPVDPVDAQFDMDENALTRLQERIRSGALAAVRPAVVPVEVGLALHGESYPLRGGIDFFDNRVDARTGTLLMKARLPNPKPSVGPRVLAPGMFVRVRIPIGKPTEKTQVPESALGTDQESRYLYTVDAEGKAQRWEAQVGLAIERRWRVVEAVAEPGGAARPLPDDAMVVVVGMQRVRPGLKVEHKPATPAAMPPLPAAASPSK